MNLSYINWFRECHCFHITIDDFENKLIQLKKEGYKKIDPSTQTCSYSFKTYSVLTKGKYKTLAIVHPLFHKELFSTNFKDDRKNVFHGQGKEAFDRVTNKFKERTGISITKAFGSTDEIFKNCVPKQFYYLNKKYIDKANAKKPIKNVSAIDYCSQYPSMLCESLPDAHPSCIAQYEGTVAPTKEYPFAFYIKSGHCAEFGKFDTHNWKQSFLAGYLLGEKDNKQFAGNPNLDPEEDVTVLMKASKFSLEPEMRYFYELRNKEQFAKVVMNAFIGMLHRENYNSHKQAHIAAIVIARANDRMQKKACEICYDLGWDNVIHICVDGCIYVGDKSYGGNQKGLNKIYQEFQNCDLKITGTNSYVAMKDGKVVKFKHGAYDSRTDGKDIEQCEGFDDMYKWYKKERMIENE